MALIPYDDALGRVLERVPTMDPVEVPIADALGLVTAEDVSSEDPVPPFDNSAVDGFALRATDVVDVPTELEILESIAAGRAPTVTLRRGTCARIMTGAVIPPGADAVVMVEHTETHRVAADTDAAVARADLDERSDDGGRGTVVIQRSADVGQHIRLLGDDLRAGELAVARGTVIRAGHVGLLATVGRAAVRVLRRPRVGVMSTGDELVEGQAPLRAGQIRDSNRVMLIALCTQAGFDAVDLGLVADDESRIESALSAAAASCDAVVTSGGVSMGDYDYVKAVLARIAEMEWMQVAMKPAKPFAFGTISGTPVFGLPGNPVSSLVSFELLARPGLRAMAGYPDPIRMRVPAVAATEMVRRRDGKTHFVRVRLSRSGSALVASATGSQGSHQLASSAAADALAVLPDGEGVAQGALLEVIPLG